MDKLTFEDWHKETNQRFEQMRNCERACQASTAGGGAPTPPPPPACTCARLHSADHRGRSRDEQGADGNNDSSSSEFIQKSNVAYREISGWPHLNDCIETLRVLNIGGTNVLVRTLILYP